MASGALDSNGIYQYGEDDVASLFSDLLNLLSSSTSTQFTDDRSRLTALETAMSALNTDSGWITIGTTGAPTFGSNWAAYTSGGWTVAAFRRVGGSVYFSGVAQKSASWVSGETVWTMPAGYAPSRRMRMFAESGSAQIMHVETTGAVVLDFAGSSGGTVAFTGSYTL